MKIAKGIIIFLLFGITLSSFMGCQPPPTVVTDPDLTGEISGPYSGNYVVNFETNPQDNYSSQINLQVSKIDKKIIRIDAQGGDSFQCSITGSSNNLILSNITHTSGVYKFADDIEGLFINGRLYYKVTGTSNGGAFYAEFTVI